MRKGKKIQNKHKYSNKSRMFYNMDDYPQAVSWKRFTIWMIIHKFPQSDKFSCFIIIMNLYVHFLII